MKKLKFILFSFALFTLSFLPFKLFPLAFISLIPLFMALEGLSKIKKTLILLAFFYLFWIIHTFWILNMEVEPGVEKWLILGLIFLPLYMSVFNVVPLLYTESRFSWLLTPSLWILFEFIRGRGDTGFPWMPIASTQLYNPAFRMLARIGGIYLIGWLILLFNVLLYLYLKKRELGILITWILLLLLLHLGGLYLYLRPENSSEKIKVAVFQPNVLPKEEYDPKEWEETAQAFNEFYKRINEKVELIVFSESALPGYFRFSLREQNLVKKISKKSGAYILLGSTDVQVEKGERILYNTAFLVKEDKIVAKYFKTHLVPFGEWLPFEDKFSFLQKLEFGQGDYRPGKSLTPLEVNGKRFGILICFESLFPEITKSFVLNGAQFLVNITNDGWYGKSLGPVEHFELLRYRAIESERFVIRSAKTGISAIIDSKGRVLKRIGLFKRGYFIHEVPLKNNFTPYTRYGDIIVYLAFLIVLSILVYNKLGSGGRND